MRVCIIGIGSIAKRHIQNLKALYGKNITIDAIRSGKGGEIDKIVLENIDSIYGPNTVPKGWYDAVFITNPTSKHYETLKKYNNLSNAFFIEKPVFLTGNEDISLYRWDGKIYYVACPMRYMKIMKRIKDVICQKKVYSVRCISSSYLPDWRPDVDYRDIYSSKKELGGGVSIDLVHEWDYICYLFGFPAVVHSIMSKKSSLEIDSEDLAIYIAEYQDKTVELHLDYFGRTQLRKMELICEDDTIIVDYIEQKIHYTLEDKIEDISEERDSYQKRELVHFFDILAKKKRINNNLEDACKVLRLARGKV